MIEDIKKELGKASDSMEDYLEALSQLRRDLDREVEATERICLVHFRGLGGADPDHVAARYMVTEFQPLRLAAEDAVEFRQIVALGDGTWHHSVFQVDGESMAASRHTAAPGAWARVIMQERQSALSQLMGCPAILETLAQSSRHWRE